jgi:hypothetical protein
MTKSKILNKCSFGRIASGSAALVLIIGVVVLTADRALGKDGDIPDRLFASRSAPMVYPPAPSPERDKLIVPPGEESYFPVRADGQPYVLNVDRTVNLTSALNQFYFNPKWRGEVWTPFDQIQSIERATMIMGTWREYDEFSELRLFNGVHKWFEKWSGFGP